MGELTFMAIHSIVEISQSSKSSGFILWAPWIQYLYKRFVRNHPVEDEIILFYIGSGEKSVNFELLGALQENKDNWKAIGLILWET